MSVFDEDESGTLEFTEFVMMAMKSNKFKFLMRDEIKENVIILVQRQHQGGETQQ